MTRFRSSSSRLAFVFAAFSLVACLEASEPATTFVVAIDRGEDVGQCFGSLFETTSEDGSIVVGAGFQNVYNTRYRGDRHSVQFFVRPTDGKREMRIEELPRPTANLVGAYLFERDGAVYSTYGGLKSWDSPTRTWMPQDGVGGTSESMRVGKGMLVFGDSRVSWNGQSILEPPAFGSYQLFFYANGYLCFYHVNRGDGPYRPHTNDEDGFSRLYACPWRPSEGHVDLSKAKVLLLPIVGETTFAWGVLGKQIVTGSNIGGFYALENGLWKTLLDPKLGESYQLYSMLGFHESRGDSGQGRLLMGQYPTGRLFAYDGRRIADQPGWPPVLEGVTSSAREAQTTVIYGGDLMVGVWPWGEVWRYNPDSQRWVFMPRMFKHPNLSAAITHPYDVENESNSPRNLWGQRVTSLVASGPDLFISTSGKAPMEWEPQRYPFLAPEKWKSYGKVYRATMQGHLSAPTRWTTGPTKLVFTLKDGELAIHQDGDLLARCSVTGALQQKLKQAKSFRPPRWGEGTFGSHGNVSLQGEMASQ